MKLNFDKIKQEIKITSYLESIGCYLSRNGKYSAPYREDRTPSLSVSNTNLWHDHGTGKGGNIIQLVALINSCTDYEAAKILTEQKDSFSFHCKPTIVNTPKSICVISTLPISEKYLIQYLASRKIPLSLAKQYCQEIHYQVRERQYYAIGFPNISRGYELRNPSYKGCTNKDITIFQNRDDQCLVFEGFFDFLSYLTLKGTNSVNQDVLVLNSLSNINKAIPILKKYDLIIGYLDNDESGKDGINKLRSNGINVDDRSHKYAPHKDLNEYLISLSGGENKVTR